MLTAGMKAPDFTLNDQNGAEEFLKAMQGKEETT